MDWLEEQYPETFPAYRKLWEKEQRNIAAGDANPTASGCARFSQRRRSATGLTEAEMNALSGASEPAPAPVAAVVEAVDGEDAPEA